MKALYLRIAAALMAFCLCFSLAACGEEGTKEESSNPPYESSQSQADITENSNPTGETALSPSDEPETALPVGGGDVAVAPASGKATEKPAAPKTTSTPAETTASRTVKVTIPEGYNIIQIAKKLEANGVCSATDFINTAQTYDFSYYPLVGSMPKKQYRAFKLEGYLFPDTYEFYKNMKPQDAVGKFLRGSKAVLSNYPSSAANLKNMDEILTLASIIEKEARTNTDKKRVSAVLHNRLSQGMKLQVDATPVYLRSYIKESIGKYKNLNSSYTAYCNAYNTYNSACKGLPAGPICNPGRSSINAAIHPSTEAEYRDMLYFCSKNGTIYYAKTDEEHKANLKKYGIEIPSV